MAAQDAQSESVLDPVLDDETLQELGLTEQPFAEGKKRQPVVDSTTQKTRASLEQNVRFGDSLHLLIGEDGAGKTVLLQQLLKHCKNNIKPFVVKGSPEFQANAFLYAVLTDLTKEEQTANETDELIDALAPIFEQITEDQLSALLIVDDAHLAPIEEIAELVDTLQHFELEDEKTARLLLTGTPALSQSIARFEAQFEDLDLKYSTTTMEPLDEVRTRDYLSTRLNQAGFADAFPFTDKAVAKIQSDSGGLPGGINASATHYLNGVYRNAGASGSKAGWLSSLEWPVLAVGAAAIGAIGLGLSMFFGNDPETEVIPVAENDNVIQIEQPIVSPSSVSNGAESATTVITPEPLVTEPLVTEPLVVESSEPSFQSDTDSNPTVVITDQIPSVVDEQETTTGAVASGDDTRLVLPENETQAPIDLQPDNSALIAGTAELPTDNATESPVEFNVPVPSDTPVAAADKSVSNTIRESSEQLSDNSLLNDSSNSLPALTTSEISTSQGTTASDDQPVGGLPDSLLDGDTDAAAQALEDNTLSTAPAAGLSANPDRAIENERWVLFQSPLKFTVQLATSRERDYIIELAQTMEVQDPVAIYPFLTTNSNNPVFGLLSGLYDTRSEAIAAVESMSESSKQFGVWIRPVSDLQADIKRRN